MHQDPNNLKRPTEDVGVDPSSKRQRSELEGILPIGKSDIKSVIESGYYVDKTDHALRLFREEASVFLARPRRFGKSLFVSTLEAIAKGNKELFKDCYIYKTNYDWKKYPVIRLDFSSMNSSQLEKDIKKKLYRIAQEYSIESSMPDPTGHDSMQSYLEDLIVKLISLHKTDANYDTKVVVLIDEYDAPFINQDNSEIKKANCLIVREFLTVIKSLSGEGKIKLEFITGVSAYCFKDANSGPNNVTDVTLVSGYATIAGYGEEVLLDEHSTYHKRMEELVGEELYPDIETLIDDMRSNYNGYKFHPDKPSVYNPLSTLKFLQYGELSNYWMSTGTPTFLIKKVNQSYAKDFSNPIPILRSELTESSEDNLTIEGAMFQGGYLTIVGYGSKDQKERRQLDPKLLVQFPNKEVEESFHNLLLKEFEKELASKGGDMQHSVLKKLNDADIEGFIEVIKSCIAGIPYNLSNPKHNRNEAFYHAALHSFLRGAKVSLVSELFSNVGRTDIVIDSIPNITYILELKYDKNAEAAITQIRNNNYVQQFTYQNKGIVAIGINFNRRHISEHKYEFYDENGDLISGTAFLEKFKQKPGRGTGKRA